MESFTIAKTKYRFIISEKTARIFREDGTSATVRDNENEIEDWVTELMEMVANGFMVFK